MISSETGADIVTTKVRASPVLPRTFLLRLPPALHRTLQAAARAGGLSLNEYCLRRLLAPAPALGVTEAGAAAVARAAEVFGEALLAVLAYGSWARGKPAATSDVDLLVVVEDSVRLTRALYRRWDDRPFTWQGRRVDPHFVHLPRPGQLPTGVWCEAALDGILLFERDARVSALLAHVRREIAAGRVVRRLAHGQPYWTAA
jgi:predicted nucleotidyltransferase